MSTAAAYFKPKKDWVQTVTTFLFFVGVGGVTWCGSYLTTEQALIPMLAPLIEPDKIRMVCFAINLSFTILEGDVWFGEKKTNVAIVCWVGCIADFSLNLLGVFPWMVYVDRSPIPQSIFAALGGFVPFALVVAFVQGVFGIGLAIVLSMGPEWALRKAFE